MVRVFLAMAILAGSFTAFAAEKEETCPYAKAKSARGVNRFDHQGALGYQVKDQSKAMKPASKGTKG
jgi:hypothetical protein